MFEEFNIIITNILLDQVLVNFDAVLASITLLFKAGSGLYFAVITYRLITGALDVKQFVDMVATVLIVNLVLFADDVFMNSIVPFVSNAGDTIALKVLGDEGQSSTALVMVDKIFENALRYMHIMWSAILDKGWKDILGDLVPAALGTFFMLVGVFMLTIYAGVYLILVKVVIAILLSVAPIFLMLATFPATRNFFTQWVGQCFNYILISILIALSFSIVNEAVMGIAAKIVESNAEGNFTTNATITPFTFLALSSMYIVGYALIQTVISLSGNLTGSMPNLGGAQTVTGLVGKTAAVAGGAAGGVAVGAGKGGKMAYGAIRDRIKNGMGKG